MQVKKTLTNVAKLSAAGAVVAAIFVAMTTAGPKAEVKPAQADILDLMPANVFAGRNTTEILVKSGLTPRAYEVNGNKVLFAVGETSAAPMDVLNYYQEQFVAAGINSKKWMKTPEGKGLPEAARQKEANLGREQLHAMNRGEVIPYFATEDYVSMGGPILRGKPIDELIEEWAKNPPESKMSIYKGWRFIDAHKKDEKTTRVTSVWADDDFDFASMRNPNEAKLGPNMKVPACPGCKLVNRTRSLEPDEPMALEQYQTSVETDAALEFYRKSMLARGWELSDTTEVMEFVASRVPDMPFNTQGKFLSFAKHDELVMVTAMHHPQAGTVVSVAEMK